MIRLLGLAVLVMLLHHEPGVCAPGEAPAAEDPEQTERIRGHLLSGELGTTQHERNMQALHDAGHSPAKSLLWAAREAIEAPRPDLNQHFTRRRKPTELEG